MREIIGLARSSGPRWYHTFAAPLPPSYEEGAF